MIGRKRSSGDGANADHIRRKNGDHYGGACRLPKVNSFPFRPSGFKLPIECQSANMALESINSSEESKRKDRTRAMLSAVPG